MVRPPCSWFWYYVLSLPIFVINSCLHLYFYICTHIHIYIYLYVFFFCASHSWASAFCFLNRWVYWWGASEAQNQRGKWHWNIAQLDGSEGAFPARPEEEARGLLTEVNLIYLPFLYHQWPFGGATPSFLFLYFSFFVFLQGLRLLRHASLLCKEAWSFGWRNPTFRNWGAEELRDGGGRFRGGRFLWAP